MKYSPAHLELVFGSGHGATAEERAKTSSRRFVRGLDELTFDEVPSAKGRRLTAREALSAYGFDKLLEVATEGSALICESVDAAGRVLRERRQQLALSMKTVASKARLAPEIIEALEVSRRRPVREYERVARVLGLDERLLSFSREPHGNQGVAVRLRSLHDSKPAMSSSVAIALAESAWVAMAQTRLVEDLPRTSAPPHFDKAFYYGSYSEPAFKVGYELAQHTRAKLGLGDEPIRSMRRLVEETLGVPVVQAELGDIIAGATVDVGGKRAIVVNLSGRNVAPFVRRFTLAHELGHLLFDPQQKLNDLRVDEYEEFDSRPDQITDRVEQRANAFAIELLAPHRAVRSMYLSSTQDPLAAVIHHFGIGYTAARYHVWNALERSVALESIDTKQSKPQPEWEAGEAYTTIYHPIHSLVDHPSRAGRFSAVAARAAELGIISWDTASEWLFCTEQELKQSASSIRDLYPDLWLKSSSVSA